MSRWLVDQIEDILGYVLREKSVGKNSSTILNTHEDNSDRSDQDEQSQETPSTSMIVMKYICSQDKSAANYSKYQSTVPVRKRRRKATEERFPCAGNVQIIVPRDKHGVSVSIPSLPATRLQEFEALFHFSHKCSHPPRKRAPVPTNIRHFVKEHSSTCRSVPDMICRIHKAVDSGSLRGVDVVDITDDNIRYWLMQIKKRSYQRDSDPWISAVKYLSELENVVVHSYIQGRRRYFCWFIHEYMGIDMKSISEVYIDSTFNTNGQSAELFAIIACEEAHGVPVGYMVMEKMPKEDSVIYRGEVTEACKRLFAHAKEKGLIPTIIHTDKSAAEIAASKVRPRP